ncbi:LPS export ABC transporter permease LptF [Pelomicrobium sp. G1]|uniref:LPS export ABC transporter permease LptF n=1 Tax=unclassified Pelomicrobium TaxID=2815318 RepID=UPI0021DBD899|nr:MAG: LPS export ABC transporter permease LptF [Burkholderiales bacterium]
MPNYPRSGAYKSKNAPRIFTRSALREFSTTGIVVFVVVLAITLVTQVIRLLDQAASGSIPAEGVLALLGFRTLSYLAPLLAGTTFVAILLSLSRAYRDSEMVVWFSAGLSLTAWVRPVLLFSVPIACIVAALALFLSPWAIAKSEELRQILRTRDDASLVSPGTFQESRHADRVFFVEAVSQDKQRVENVFVQSMEKDTVAVMVARIGRVETAENGDRFLVMESGARFDGPPGSPEYRIMHFDRYAVRIQQAEARPAVPSTKSRPFLELLENRTPEHVAELGRRLSQPISAVLLALLAIPLAQVNPRAGRSLNLVMAILIYMIYTNTLSVAQVWVAFQRIDPALGLWGVHGAMLAFIAAFFYRRLSVFSLGRLRA